jgi:hypothetical protein
LPITRHDSTTQHRQIGPAGFIDRLGCKNFVRTLDPTAARAVIHKALDLASRFSIAPTSMAGGAETILGEVVGARRKNGVLTS